MRKIPKKLEVVPVSKDDEIKGLFELINFIENKNSLIISFDSFPDEEENTTVGFGKTTRNTLAKFNSNAILKEKRNIKKSGTKSKVKANPARKNRADRNANAVTENEVTNFDINSMVDTLPDERKNAAIEAFKYFVSYMKTKSNCTISIDCSKQEYSIFRNAILKKLYEKILTKAKVAEQSL